MSGIFVAVPAPIGRTNFEGQITAIKEFEGVWGSPVYRMKVMVEAPEGCWFCSVRVPRSLLVEAHRQCGTEGPAGWLMFKRVALSATLVPTRQEHEAHGKRPTKARFL